MQHKKYLSLRSFNRLNKHSLGSIVLNILSSFYNLNLNRAPTTVTDVILPVYLSNILSQISLLINVNSIDVLQSHILKLPRV